MSNLFYEKKGNKFLKIIVFVFIILLIFLFIFDKKYFLNIKFDNAMKKEIKKEIDSNNILLPTWNLNDLYEGINDYKIQEDLLNIKNSVKKFEVLYKNNIKNLSGYELYKSLIEYERINELMGKISSYAYLKYAENLNIEENTAFYQKICEELTKISTNLVFFTLEINKLQNANLNRKFRESSNLKNYYGRYIEISRMYQEHQLSENLEKYSAEKSITSSQAWSRLFDQTIDGMKFNFKGQDLNEAEIINIMNGKNKNDRKLAGKVFGEKLGENINLLAYITNILAKDKSISDEWRNFKTPMSSRNLSNLIEDDVVENLYNSVQNNYNAISHRYYKLKSKIMGVDKMHYTDRNAPLPFDDNKKYTWEEAKDIVKNAYLKFSPELARIGEEFFNNNWIDVATRAGKRGGAFAHPVVPSIHPYLLLNFTGTTRDVMTLAHELGHGIHMYLAREQGYFMSDTPLTIAETASVFGEQLVFRYLLENETDKDKKIAIIANKIEDMINTVVRQIAFLEFEKTVHEERKNGEISVDRLNEIWMNVQTKSLGDSFIYNDEYKYYWSYIPHFIHSPFYVYAYAFGDCLVNSLYSKYLQKSDGFQDKYINLLKAGGSEDYIELLKPFNLNPKNEDFWQNGMDLIISLIDELEVLVNEK